MRAWLWPVVTVGKSQRLPTARSCVHGHSPDAMRDATTPRQRFEHSGKQVRAEDMPCVVHGCQWLLSLQVLSVGATFL